MTGSWIDHTIWSAVVPDLPLNPEAALYRFWREQRAQGVYLGVPITGEIETEAGTMQAFSSGAVIVWHPERGVGFAHDV